MGAAAHFAQSYDEARRRFLAAAGSAGLQIDSHVHPLPGRDGEILAMDVARDGPAEASSLLILSSGCHGVEGFCGSGLQLALLADKGWRDRARAAGVAVLHVHALNPHGFSWWRRTTHENIDLNRNFCDFAGPLPASPEYDELADLLVPETWPPDAAVLSRIGRYVAERGERALQQAISGGQYRHPDGLFYGGNAPSWSQTTLRRVLREHGRQARRLAWIDVHTGLGPSGHGERIYAGPDEAETIARARAWWGPITSIYDGSSTSARLTGMMWEAAPQECPDAEYTGIALEYGTLPQPEVIDALRADQWLQNHPEAGAEQRAAIKRQIRDAFYTDTDAWKERVLEQGIDAAEGAVRGLAAG